MTNYPESFEAALKQRFAPLEMKGASSPEEFSQLLRQELGPNANNLTEKELKKLGREIYTHQINMCHELNKKDQREHYPISPITGRNVGRIASPFVSGNDKMIVANEKTILSASTNKIKDFLPELCIPATYDRVANEIENHIKEIIQSEMSGTAEYNKR